MNRKNKLLAGCVILYNPDTAVVANIDSYLHFLDVLYLIDNSEEVTQEVIDNICSLSSKINYISNSKNLGIASALNIAANLAVNDNYCWLLTMDQDSCFNSTKFFDTWKKEVIDDNNVGLVTASYTNFYDRWQKDYSEDLNEIHYVITSGNIINLIAWKKVNGYEDKLFIDEVDHEYCLKLRKNGYKILITKEKLMGHAIGEFYPGSDDYLKSKKGFIIHAPIRYYYMSRNVLYLCKKYFFIDLNFALLRFFYLVKILFKILLKYPHKLIYLESFFKGIKDFALSRYNQYK